jgi:hypothetical protein
LESLLTAEEQFWITPQPYLDLQPRDSQGRGTEAQTTARRLKTLELYANLSSAQVITRFITELGYSITTAKEDLSWAKARWAEMQDSEETAYDIIQRHSNKYYEWSHAAEQQGELRLAADMLSRIERLRGFHQSNTMIQVNTNVSAAAGASLVFNADNYTLDELKNLQLLLAKNGDPAADETT